MRLKKRSPFQFALICLFFSSYLFAKSPPTDSQIQGRLNIVNGHSAECVMDRFFTSDGWISIEGEIGRHGIDGLYYKKHRDTIKEVLVAESKWNTSRLGYSGKNSSILQMSKRWVLRTLTRLENRLHRNEYTTIRSLIDNNQYRARLFRLKPVGDNKIQIIITKIKNKGADTVLEIGESRLPLINLNKPDNGFESEIVRTYNACRKMLLRKYFSDLNDSDIASLLVDNNIQKSDIKNRR